jgi:hypothetical protein
MIFTAVKNSISYNNTRVKNNDSNVALLFLIVVVVLMVVVVVVVAAMAEAAAFVISKLCHTNGVHWLCRPVLVECSSDGMTLMRTNSVPLECIHLTSFSGFSSVIHGKCHYRT